MRVYCETNFLLESAYRQEEHAACERLLVAAEAGTIELRVPAVCLSEASASIVGRLKARKQVFPLLEREERQIERGDRLGVDQFKEELAALRNRLIDFVDRDDRALAACRTRLLNAGCVLPVSERAAELADELLLAVGEPGYGPTDALIAGCVVADLAERPAADAVFVTTDGPFRTHPFIKQRAERAHLGLRATFRDVARQALGA